jgi:hypothetical protein
MTCGFHPGSRPARRRFQDCDIAPDERLNLLADRAA